MRPNEVITEVRRLIADNRAPYRYSDSILLGMVNQALKRMAVVRPDLFSYAGEITTTAGTTLQTLPSDAVRLVEIFQVKDGNAVTEADRRTLDRMYPEWPSETAGDPINFMRHPRNPNKYFLYPKPAEDVILIGEYIQTPEDYDIDEEIGIPEGYFTPLVDCTVFLSQSVDDEHVNSGRAKLFYDTFLSALSTALDARNMIDSDRGAVKREDGL